MKPRRLSSFRFWFSAFRLPAFALRATRLRLWLRRGRRAGGPLSAFILAGSLVAQQVAPPTANADLAPLKARAYQLYEAKDYSAAAAQFQAYLARQTDDARALFDYAGVLSELNRHAEAARQLELLHQQKPQHEVGYFRLGVTYVLLGRGAEAEPVFTQLQQSTN